MAKVKTKKTRIVPREINLQAWYYKEIRKQIRQMNKEVRNEISLIWKMNENPLAQDSTFAEFANNGINRLKDYWLHKFDTFAEEVAEEFAKRAEKNASTRLKNLLIEGGFAVKFTQTPKINNLLQVTVFENVNLIKSISPYYFTQVETIVMQGVKNGRDLRYISTSLQEQLGVSQRKAELIARDQSNKANFIISRARTLETGITRAIWVHIPGKKTSRETHRAMNGQEFDLREGLYDPAVNKKIFPGELINCNCTYRIIIPDTMRA